MCVIVAVTIPIERYTFNVETTNGFDSMVPHDSSWFHKKMSQDHSGNVFGSDISIKFIVFWLVGSLSVYRIVFENDNGQNMMTNESNWCHEFNDIRLYYTVIDGFTSTFVLNGDILQLEEVETVLTKFSALISYIGSSFFSCLLIRLHTMLRMPPTTKLPL